MVEVQPVEVQEEQQQPGAATVEATAGVLLDAGEGCLGALRRRYGEKTEDMICGLELVWISHMHADHHCGKAARHKHHHLSLSL